MYIYIYNNKISYIYIYVGYIILIWYVDAFLQHQSGEINLVIVASHRHPVDPGSLSSHNSNVFLDSYHSLPQVPTWKKERYSQNKIPANNLVDGWNLLDHRFKPKRSAKIAHPKAATKIAPPKKSRATAVDCFFGGPWLSTKAPTGFGVPGTPGVESKGFSQSLENPRDFFVHRRYGPYIFNRLEISMFIHEFSGVYFEGLATLNEFWWIFDVRLRLWKMATNSSHVVHL